MTTTSNALAAPVVDMQMQPRTDGVLAMIERLATTPGFDPINLEKLIDLHERTMATQAKKAYSAAFADMQQKLPSIFRTGRGHNNITYAKNHDIQEALRPVLYEFGFGISFRTAEEAGKLRVKLVLAHRDGHSEESELVIGADTTGNKNAIQAMGSSQTYAQRYLTLAMLNITSHDDPTDDDGQSAGRGVVVDPKGFDEWVVEIDKAAEKGSVALRAAWNTSSEAFRVHMTKHYRDGHEARKRRAAAVKP